MLGITCTRLRETGNSSPLTTHPFPTALTSAHQMTGIYRRVRTQPYLLLLISVPFCWLSYREAAPTPLLTDCST